MIAHDSMTRFPKISSAESSGETRQSAGARRRSLAIFALLAVVHTWPLASDPAHLSRNDNADTVLNTWAIAWVAHQLPRDPARVFDGNIFHPEPLTLAYSESMIVQGVLAMPVLALGGSPVLAYNVVLMAGFALTSWAFWLLIQRWTGSTAAAYVGGSLAGFNASVLVRLPHLQTQHAEFIPLMLFALDRVLVSRRTRDALLLGLGFALQGLTSVYLMAFSTWMLIFACAGRSRDWLRQAPVQTALRLVVAAIAAVVLLAPYLLAYYNLHLSTGFERGVGDALLYAGSWIDYLSTGSRFHHPLWSHNFFGRAASASFPGIAGAVLACLALVWPETRRDSRVHMCLAAAVGCAAVSFAPRAPFYPMLHQLIPLFRVVRVEAHLGQIVLMMLAVLAGFGVSGIARRWDHVRFWRAIALTICLLVNLEALRAPFRYREFTRVPRVYDFLATVPAAVIADLPLWPPRITAPNVWPMLYSTRHWHPILNGYSGYLPPSYPATFESLRNFPDDTSLIALHERGVTHVVVHKSELNPERFAAIAGVSSLQPQDDDGEIYIYKLRN
jgi:hypothetical protein